MSRSKKIFAGFAFAFLLLLLYVVYDISSRTTFPGTKRKEGVHENIPADSLRADPGDSLP